MIGNYHEDLKLIEALKEASGLDATEDDTNHLFLIYFEEIDKSADTGEVDSTRTIGE